MARFTTRRSAIPAALALALALAGSAAAQQRGIGKACPENGDNAPQIALNVDTAAPILAGTRVKLTASGTSSSGDVLQYMWHADRGRIFGRGAAVEFDTAGLAPGSYDVVLLGRGRKCGTARIVKSIEVVGCPPGITLSANNTRVNAGEVVTVSASGVPEGFGLRWSTTDGRLTETGGGVTIDTAGVAADTITVSAASTDVANCTSQLTIAVVKPPVALPDILTFPMAGGRLNNANKAVLDDVTIRGSQDVGSRIVITGKSTAKERAGLAKLRAENARNYLVSEKGVDPSRIEIRTQERTATEGGIEIAVVPPGATYQ
jgi:hypothetical protein